MMARDNFYILYLNIYCITGYLTITSPISLCYLALLQYEITIVHYFISSPELVIPLHISTTLWPTVCSVYLFAQVRYGVRNESYLREMEWEAVHEIECH